ncbi:hypothetical protein [Desertivirga arenae]|uniref:hypothetical protein n=1 Tax=Desertivirga arenae TaxID=2810309 RepID=UPI001A95EC7E|nr:hypothetical protein [Pedobacter sp. SYSU D00823]
MENNKRVARLTWNDKGYVLPSGGAGKSTDKDSHEYRFGYGHEEWLFDVSKLIDGYHYGFLQPVRQYQEAYTGGIYSVMLYTINKETKLRYWVGDIERVEVIDEQEALRIRGIYKDRGWLNEMEEQILESGGSKMDFANYPGIDLFNVRFRPKDINVTDPYLELPSDHPLRTITRYTFARFKEEFQPAPNFTSPNFQFIPPDQVPEPTDVGLETRKSIRPPQSVEITYLHSALSNILTRRLREIHGNNNVTAEHPSGNGRNRIDVLVNSKEGLIFYEIKTYNSLLTSIREAFGQLLEYAIWPEKMKASKLVIVTHLPASADVSKYLKYIRDQYNLPLYYQHLDWEKGKLSEEF